MTKRVGIFVSGGGSNMVALVRAMQAERFAEPVLVLSNHEAAGGIIKAQDLSVPTCIVSHKARTKQAFEAEIQSVLDAHSVELVALAGFMRVLSADFVAAWRGRLINIHPSLLPKYPGLNTHARALDAGDVLHGCTVHEVVADVDAGPILGQAHVDVLEGDTEDSLALRVLRQEHRLYPRVLKQFVSGDRTPLILPKESAA